MKKFIYLFSIVIFTLACKKNSESEKSKIYLLNESISSVGTQISTLKHTYDNDNRLIETFNTEAKLHSKYIYDEKNRVIEMYTYTDNGSVIGPVNQRVNFTYPSATVVNVITTYFDSFPQQTSQATITLDAKQRIIKNDLGTSGIYLYQYDTKGNLKSITIENRTISSTQTVTLSYDQKKNPHNNITGNLFSSIYATSTNNITESVSVVNSSPSNSTKTEKMVYEYNDAGYPIKQNISTTVSGSDIINYKTIDYSYFVK